MGLTCPDFGWLPQSSQEASRSLGPRTWIASSEAVVGPRSRMLFVFCSAHTLADSVGFAHVSPRLGMSVIFVAGKMENL